MYFILLSHFLKSVGDGAAWTLDSSKCACVESYMCLSVPLHMHMYAYVYRAYTESQRPMVLPLSSESTYMTPLSRGKKEALTTAWHNGGKTALLDFGQVTLAHGSHGICSPLDLFSGLTEVQEGAVRH